MSSGTLPSTWARMKRDQFLRELNPPLIRVLFVRHFISSLGYLVNKDTVADAVLCEDGSLGFYDTWMTLEKVVEGYHVKVVPSDTPLFINKTQAPSYE
jgi:hypothetical protein